jgi:membrane-associated protease RseP (regulator of RpoE activity)
MKNLMLVVAVSLIMFSCSDKPSGENSSSGKITFTDTPWIGIEVSDSLNPLKVTDVVTNSPAEKAGVKEGDIIKAFNSKPLENVASLQTLIAESGAFKKATITIVRGETSDTLMLRPTQLFLMDDVVLSPQEGNCNTLCNCTYDSSGICVIVYRYKGPRPGGGGQRFGKACNDKECFDVILL